MRRRAKRASRFFRRIGKRTGNHERISAFSHLLADRIAARGHQRSYALKRAQGQDTRFEKHVASTVARLTAPLARRKPGLVQDAFEARGLALAHAQPDYHYVHRYFGSGSHKLRTPLEDRQFLEVAERVCGDDRTLLYYDRLYTLYQAFTGTADRAGPDAHINVAEVGVYRGGTSFFLACLAERLGSGRVTLVAVDTFEGHSELDLPEGHEERHRRKRFGKETSYDTVLEYLSPFPFVEVVKARIQDAAPRFVDRTFGLVHLDVDLYQPTAFSLDFFGTRMASGGTIVVDDYGAKTCPGVRRAVDEFALAEQGFTRFELQTGQCLLIRAG